MSRTDVSDLSPLADLNLERIFIRKTKVSKEQVEEFKSAQPNCKVYR
jgi:hypothetical protein